MPSFAKNLLFSAFSLAVCGACSGGGLDRDVNVDRFERDESTKAPAPNESDVPDGNKSDVTEEKSIEIDPGVRVAKVGVNFEDGVDLGDKDYNDAVTCFQGNFRVNNTDVVSLESQTVNAAFSSLSSCEDVLRIVTIHPDGTSEEQTVVPKTQSSATLQLKAGSKIEIYMRVGNTTCPKPDIERNMHTGISSIPDAKVLLDLCNTTGQ